MDKFVRSYLTPLALTAFLETARFENLTEHFAFVVRYKEREEVVLTPHTDTSIIKDDLCVGRRARFTGGHIHFSPWDSG